MAVRHAGGFLNDAGWLKECEKVFISCMMLCKTTSDVEHWTKTLECCVRQEAIIATLQGIHGLIHYSDTVLLFYDVGYYMSGMRTANLRRPTSHLWKRETWSPS